MRLRILLVLAVFLALPAGAHAANFTKIDGAMTMDDGVSITYTLYEPTTPKPAAGYPAIMMFHGLGGKRQDMNTLAENSFANEGYAVLTFDARGHGASGGLFSLDGPREIADFKALFAWLGARPEIDGKRVGAWGISLGGGAVWRSIVDGIPFAAGEVVETWTDLISALAPQGLSKTGLIFGFLQAVPTDRTAAEVLAVKGPSLASDLNSTVTSFAAQRSSRQALSTVKTPMFLFQGRRDYAFDIDQAWQGYKLLKGPKRLYIGDFGHPPSTFPGPDISVVLAEGGDWFARFLKDAPNGIDKGKPIQLAPSPWKEAGAVSYATLPATKRLAFTLPGSTTIAASGKVVRAVRVPKGLLETFGSPTVMASLSSRTSFAHLVAVLSARLPDGADYVLGEGGVPLNKLSKTPRPVTIRLAFWANTLPAGSKVRLTLAATSTAQSASNLVYFSSVPDGSTLTVGKVTLTVPVLLKPISG
jgi:ABC-2 type transport system ATP-binding protein